MQRRICFATVVLALAGSSLAQQFSQSIVAGTNSDLMIVRHVVIRGTNQQIGKKLAELAVANHHAKLQAVPPKVLDQRLTWFNRNYPEVIARGQGVRAALKPAPGLDTTSLPYDLDIAPGCSVVFYPPASVSNGHAMMSRNYDFPKARYADLAGKKAPAGARSMTGDPYVIEMHPDHGYASLYTCAYDLLEGAIDGVNEKGVTVALLADDMSKKHTRGTPWIGLGEIDLTRYILDKAASAKEARALLKSVPYYATFTACHYMIADSTGDSFIFEVDSQDKHHVIDGKGKPQIVTNHSLFEYGTENLPSGNSFDRYRRLEQEVKNRKGRVTPAEVKTINYCVAVPESVRVHGTLWHAVYDLTSRSVQISFCLSGDEAKERRTPYLAFRLQRS
jgi:hypothetical protein